MEISREMDFPIKAKSFRKSSQRAVSVPSRGIANQMVMQEQFPWFSGFAYGSSAVYKSNISVVIKFGKVHWIH